MPVPPLGPPGQNNTRQTPSRGWDKLELGGWVIPGHARVTRAHIKTKIDQKKKPGRHGGNPTLLGLDPQPVEVEITTYSDADRDQLLNVLDELPLPGRVDAQTSDNKIAVAVSHPSLVPLGISSVLIVGVSGLLPVQGQPQQARMTFDLLHWLPNSNKDATATAAGAPVRKPKNNRTGTTNPPPTQQKGFGGPPAGLKPN